MRTVDSKVMWTTCGLLVAACGGSGGGSTSDSGGSSGQGSESSGAATSTEGVTTSGTTSGTTEGGSMSDTQSTVPTTTNATDDATTAGDTTTTTTAETDSTTQGVSVSDSTTSTGDASSSDGTDSTTEAPPVEKSCSADLHAVVDEQGQVLETCAGDQGCADGVCVAACDAAAASKANFGCTFMVPTPPAYPPALPPCFAVFLANTVRPKPPERPRTRRSAAIPGKRAFRRGWARPEAARRGPERTGFWQRFGNALATRGVRDARNGCAGADARAERRTPGPLAERRPTPIIRTSETIYYLPGTIDIRTLRAIQRARRGSSDRQVIHRAMVRGHWRRAGAEWKDQRVRWIKPYWRGPSTASTIERQYRLLQ